MKNDEKNDIMLQANTNIIHERIDFVKEFNDLKNNKIVQISVAIISGLFKKKGDNNNGKRFKQN